MADFSAHYPPSSQDDITWFQNALERQERKFFVAFVLKEPRKVPEILYELMMRAAVYERDPSKNRAFVQPCVATFGLHCVNETLLQWFESGSDLEKAGAVQALYHLGLVGVPGFLLAAAGLRCSGQIGCRSLDAPTLPFIAGIRQ